jgi:UPF0755 protein
MTHGNGDGLRGGESGGGLRRRSGPRPPYVDEGWDDYDPAASARDDFGPQPGADDDRRDYRSPRSGGLGTVVRFTVFTGILASLVLGGLYFFARPAMVHAISSWAAENPTALKLPFVADIVRSDLGESLTKPVDAMDQREIAFQIKYGQTPADIAQALENAGIITDARAFVFEAIERDETSYFIAGRHVVTKAMTIDQIIDALTSQPVAPPTVHIVFVEGLRIDQIVAKLEYLETNPTVPGVALTLNVAEYRDLATNPPQSLLAQYPWLKLPAGASLEGFLFPATYDVDPSISALALIEKQLDAFAANAPPELFKLPPDQLYQAVQIGSMVEKEAKLDADRAPVAGVFVNRLDPKKWPTGLLQSDPTVIYANDTVWLQNHLMSTWVDFTFWLPISGGTPLAQVPLPDSLVPYNTYKHAGLPPTPICSPGAASLAAAVAPDTADGYFFFLAKNDGTGGLAFAKTQAEHNANLKKYGYIK